MNTSTNFADSKRRVIRMSEKGAFFIMKDGKKQYNPTAKFIKTTEGNMRVIRSENKVPAPIAPVMDRKERSNKGVARGPREGKILRNLFTESEKMEKARKAKKEKKEKKEMISFFNPVFRI